MYEHVGIANLPVYFAIIGRLLAPGGVLLNHGICTNGASDYPLGPPGGDFIDRHVFPGGQLPHLSTVVRGICRSELELVDIEDLRPHYALTLRHWVRRLEAEAEAATPTRRKGALPHMAAVHGRRGASLRSRLAHCGPGSRLEAGG